MDRAARARTSVEMAQDNINALKEDVLRITSTTDKMLEEVNRKQDEHTKHLETEVAVLKSDVTRMTPLFEKIEVAIGKMGDASNNIARMLAVHEERLDRQDTNTEELFTLVEKRKTELQMDIKELHSRITTVTRELAVDISDTEHRVIASVCSNMTDMKKYIAELNTEQNNQRQLLDTRLAELEKWKWIILGGSVILGSFSHEIIGMFTK